MIRKTILLIIKCSLLVLLFLPLTGAAGNNNSNGKTDNKEEIKSATVTGKAGSAYRFYINNINMPINQNGVLADVNIPDSNPLVSGTGGKFAGDVFLFSSGFFLSGYSGNKLFTNAVAASVLVRDYIPGTLEADSSDSRVQLYLLKKQDEAFGQSWQDWKDAVSLGADFYDGNNDGEYNPVDLNANGKWDGDEDRPDLLGDQTAWCVYNDGLPRQLRRWDTVEPVGIEIRQSLFGFASMQSIGNILFVRYRLKYVGLNVPGESDKLDSVYFGIWADPDIGNADDDFVGCDILRNCGYTYNDGPEASIAYSFRPPAFFLDYLSGPVSYVPGETFTDANSNGIFDNEVDIPIDTAFSNRGAVLGIKIFPGAKNLGMSSFVQNMNGEARIEDPNSAEQARYYMLGLDKDGGSIDPCNFPYGSVMDGMNCTGVDNAFWYSGDPVNKSGWINTFSSDTRQMINTGPFILEKGIEKEILAAYIAGQGDDAINSVIEARKIDDLAQAVYDGNFRNFPTAVTDPKDFRIIPSAYSINQNYPNPFNPATTIEYTVPYESNILIKVYNSLGELVSTLTNEIKPAGYYFANFNGSFLSSGNYFCMIEAESKDGKHSFNKVIKMVLLK